MKQTDALCTETVTPKRGDALRALMKQRDELFARIEMLEQRERQQDAQQVICPHCHEQFTLEGGIQS